MSAPRCLVLAGAIASFSLLAGCLGIGGDNETRQPCASQNSCEAQAVCGHHGYCLNPDEVLRLSLTWTINGEVASESSCSDIASLEINLNTSEGEALVYTSVTCSVGLITYPFLPRTITGVGLRAYAASDPQGSTLAYADAALDGDQGQVSVDLDLVEP